MLFALLKEGPGAWTGTSKTNIPQRSDLPPSEGFCLSAFRAPVSPLTNPARSGRVFDFMLR